MENQACWGSQIGGIQASNGGVDQTAANDDSPRQFSVDHEDRVVDFMNRHGGPARAECRQGQMDAGSRGWLEIYAADGYALRAEWSRNEMRATMRVSELRPLGQR